MPQAGRRKGRQLSPEEKWQVFLEVTSQELTQADAARKWQVDVSTIQDPPAGQGRLSGRVRRGQAGPAAVAFEAELEIAQAENARLSEALKELAVELTLVRGKARSG